MRVGLGLHGVISGWNGNPNAGGCWAAGRERDVDSIEGSLAALFLDAVSGPGQSALCFLSARSSRLRCVPRRPRLHF
eukprot:1427131-Rhodomonas_salina.3